MAYFDHANKCKDHKGIFSLELLRWHIIWNAFKSHHIIFKTFTTYINYNRLLLTIIKKMYETKNHEIQKLTFNKADIIV